MRDWNTPAEVEKDGLYFIKILHITVGAVIWDFVSTLDYEWSVWTGRRKYLWTIWLYTSCRVAVTAWLTLILIIQTVGSHCSALETAVEVLSFFTIAGASLMIALRIIAIWQRKKLVMVVSYGLVLACFVLNVQSLISSRTRVAPGQNACLRSTSDQRWPSSGTLLTDLPLIVLMLVGLLRLKEARQFGVVQYMYRQGIVWMVLIIAAEVPGFVLSYLERPLGLNNPATLMMQPFEVSALCICATRMYRGLANYSFHPESIEVPVTDLERRGDPHAGSNLGCHVVWPSSRSRRTDITIKPAMTLLADCERLD